MPREFAGSAPATIVVWSTPAGLCQHSSCKPPGAVSALGALCQRCSMRSVLFTSTDDATTGLAGLEGLAGHEGRTDHRRTTDRAAAAEGARDACIERAE